MLTRVPIHLKQQQQNYHHHKTRVPLESCCGNRCSTDGLYGRSQRRSYPPLRNAATKQQSDDIIFLNRRPTKGVPGKCPRPLDLHGVDSPPGRWTVLVPRWEHTIEPSSGLLHLTQLWSTLVKPCSGQALLGPLGASSLTSYTRGKPATYVPRW